MHLEEEIEVDCLVDHETEELQPCISLHAIEGIGHATSMRVQGQVSKRLIQVLIDSASTHDFLDFNLARKLGWKDDNYVFPSVEVAVGQKLTVHGVWKGFKWKMQGLEVKFTSELWNLTPMILFGVAMA